MVECFLEDECSAIKCGAYAHYSTTPPDVAKGFIAKNPAIRNKNLGKSAHCYCDPGFVPDDDPKDRCKKDCEIGYQATGPRCTGSFRIMYDLLSLYNSTTGTVKYVRFLTYES